MKYGPIPVGLVEKIALRSDSVPIPILDFLMPLLQTRAIMAAVRLGVFEGLRAGPRKADDLARELKLDPAMLELLLRLLCSRDYVRGADGRFELGDLGRRTMLRGSPQDLTGFAEFNYWQWEQIGRLEELLVSGRGIDLHGSLTEEKVWADYQRAMLEMASLAKKIVASLMPIKRGARTLLDIGGSHGLFAAEICRKHPPLRATVLELPSAIEHARALAREAGIEELVLHAPGDLTHDDFGTGVDAVLLANIVHHYRPEVIVDMLKRARHAMTADATIGIWDMERRRAEARPELIGDATSLFFHVTSNASCYSAEEYSGFLREAGFAQVHVRRPIQAPVQILVHGTNPATAPQRT